MIMNEMPPASRVSQRSPSIEVKVVTGSSHPTGPPGEVCALRRWFVDRLGSTSDRAFRYFRNFRSFSIHTTFTSMPGDRCDTVLAKSTYNNITTVLYITKYE